jgi:hypothetical protein
MIARALRLLRMKRDLDRRLRARKVIRLARAEASRKGVSTYWRNAAQRTREMGR